MKARGKGPEKKSLRPVLEAWEGEDFLARSRLILAGVGAILVYFHAAGLGRQVEAGRLLILIYLLYSLLDLFIAQLPWGNDRAAGLCLHAMEVTLITLLAMFTGGPQSPFLVLYLVALLAAAWKWGVNGALLTGCACILVWLSGLAFPTSGFRSTPQWVGSVSAIMTFSVILVGSACLLGVLVEREKKQQGDRAVITRLIKNAVREPSFSMTVGYALRAVREHFNADRVRLAIQETKGERAVAWEVTCLAGETGNGVQSWKLTESARRACFAMPPEQVRHGLGLYCVEAGHGRAEVGAKGQNRPSQGRWVSYHSRTPLLNQHEDGFDELNIVHERHSPFVICESMLATSFLFGGKWLGRLTVYNPRKAWNLRTGARFLETLVREVGPAAYQKYMVARLRSRAQARERLRLAQELHDGIIQSLIGLEMEIELLRRSQAAAREPSHLLQGLHGVQSLLHEEIEKVREEMQRIKPLEVPPSRLIEHMAGVVDRFRRERDITASFVAESEDVSLPVHICTELARIVQEALVNVRKHSGAHNVFVHFGRKNGGYELSIEDDGCGLGFTGRLSPADAEAWPRCPLVIKERVRAIGGELVIESSEGWGSRLGISVPLTAHGSTGTND
jgi:signal transduction histidine kinase